MKTLPLAVLVTTLVLLTPSAAIADGSATRIVQPSDLLDVVRWGRMRNPPSPPGTLPGTARDRPSPFVRTMEDLILGERTTRPIVGAVGAFEAWRRLHEALSALDAELDRRMADGEGGPEVPSSCAEKADCNACFEAAYREVNFTRITLERLRSIHSRTISMIKWAEGFGDSVSSMHGVMGLSWQSSKAGIERQRAQFNQTTHAKYQDLLGNMRRGLDMVAECEANHFDNPDWYGRYGFMYMDFVRMAYRPSDG
ncbi:hypothetical protein [Myxococcus sp. RHSTA-1-4]|uniref:hypothetical protein n=1 Tax=Myxococcus sp. RHSTA-1-4 TaxID=2874601 RepID=UPI001CBA9523|nr:hypothetical protein [Myxococcus sp. RHSTA-1-4]MBZ4421280.1 hypothetical protein [Myxococcus sp. RHSTA-1-4]